MASGCGRETRPADVPAPEIDVRAALADIGYRVDLALPIVLRAFQRHWRPEAVTGEADAGTRGPGSPDCCIASVSSRGERYDAWHQWHGARHPDGEPVRLAREFYRACCRSSACRRSSTGTNSATVIGARTAIGIEPCDPAHASERFMQQRVGLHHLCLRARSREDVDVPRHWRASWARR